MNTALFADSSLGGLTELTAPLAAAPGFIDERLWLAAGWTMIHFLWVGAAIGLAAWGFRSLLKWFPPQVRYAASLIVLGALAAAPFVIFSSQLDRAPAATGVSLPLSPPVAAPAVVVAPPVIGHFSPAVAVAPPVSATDAIYASVAKWLTTIADYAPWIWAIGAGAMYSFLACGLLGAERLRRRSRAVANGEINDICRRLSAALRISRPVAVAVSKRVVAPMLVGVVKPLVLLPAAMLDAQSTAQIEMILLHELAHVRRWDNLVNLVQRLIEAALFFHPAVWLVSRWVRLEREHCCDEVVLSHSNDPRAYAETLAALAIPGLSPAHAAAAMANHQLLVRIRHILNLEDRRMTLSAKALTMFAALVVTGALLVAARAQSNAADNSSDANSTDAAKAKTAIDESVLNRFAERRLKADAGADDADFLRRLTLDVTGAAPSPDDVKLFVADTNKQKRWKKVSQLLAQADASKMSPQLQQAIAQEELAEAQLAQARAVRKQLETAGAKDALVGAYAKRSWGPEQATGAPDAQNGSDSPNAWASLTPDGQDEWLELGYAQPVDAVAVLVYENLSPGALTEVSVSSADQPGLAFTWKGTDPTKKTEASGISVIPLRVPLKTQKVKLTLDSKNVLGWNEIDAVGLLDREGHVHWASSATASSTYADQVAQAPAGPYYVSDGSGLRWQSSVDATGNVGTAAWTSDLVDQGRPAWSAMQATGAPDAQFGVDDPKAWASQDPDGGEEWLKLEYEKPVNAVAILVYESFNPGAVRDVLAYDSAGKEFTAISGRKPDSATKSGILTVPLAERREISSVKLILETKAVPGWNEIDAVGILDTEGKLHWAKSATASSSFGVTAVSSQSVSLGSDVNVAWWTDSVHQKSCLACHENAHQTGGKPTFFIETSPHKKQDKATGDVGLDAERLRLDREMQEYRERIDTLQKTIDRLEQQQKDLLDRVHSRAVPEKPSESRR